MSELFHPIVSWRKANTDYALYKLNQQALRIERGYLGQGIIGLTEKRLPSIANLTKDVLEWKGQSWAKGLVLRTALLTVIATLVDYTLGPIAGEHQSFVNDLHWGVFLGFVSIPFKWYLNERRAGRISILAEQLIASGNTAKVAEILSGLKEGTQDFIVRKLGKVNEDIVLREFAEPAPKPEPEQKPAPAKAVSVDEPKAEETIDLAAALEEAKAILGAGSEKK